VRFERYKKFKRLKKFKRFKKFKRLARRGGFKRFKRLARRGGFKKIKRLNTVDFLHPFSSSNPTIKTPLLKLTTYQLQLKT
jgi:hypothetical protein